MCSFIIKDREGDSPLIVELNKDAENSLYTLVQDYNDPTWVAHNIFLITNMIAYMSQNYIAANYNEEIKCFIGEKYTESLLVLDDLFNLFNNISTKDLNTKFKKI